MAKKQLFVIGDSISMRYGPFLKQMTKDFFLYDRKGGESSSFDNIESINAANGGDSSMVLAYLKQKLDDENFHPDILLLNAGLHDIKTDPVLKTRQVPPENYQKNLFKMAKLLTDKKIFSVWANTTAVDDEIHNSKKNEYHRYNKDVLLYNSFAKEVFSKYCWPIVDLYSFTKGLGGQLYMDHVHFTDNIAKLQAAFIAGFLMALDL